MTLEILNQNILGNTLMQWITAVAALIITVLMLRITQRLVGRRLAALANQTETYWDDAFAAVVAQTKLLFLLMVGVFVGAYFLQPPDRIQSIISSLFAITLFIQMGIWGWRSSRSDWSQTGNAHWKKILPQSAQSMSSL